MPEDTALAADISYPPFIRR